MGRKKAAKVVKIHYGIFGKPHSRKIERAIEKWAGKGYKLKDRYEHPSGCLFYPQLGHTELLFVLDDKED